MMNINEVLASGVHYIWHTKKDGTRVQRRVTIDPTLVKEYEPKTDQIRRMSPDLMRVWDLDKGSWVSIYPATVEVIRVGAALADY